MATKLKNFREIKQMLDDVRDSKDGALPNAFDYIDRLHAVINNYEIDIQSLINRYNRNTNNNGN
jgi:hypothetical protein